MQGFHNDPRGLAGQEMWESEQRKRLNPYGPARPQTPEERPTPRERLRQLWRRLTAFLTPGARGNDTPSR